MHIRTVEMKIFAPGNRKFIRRRVIAGSKKAFTDAGVDGLLDLAASVVERLYPEHDYTVVEVGPGKFNFVWRGERAKPSAGEQYLDEQPRPWAELHEMDADSIPLLPEPAGASA